MPDQEIVATPPQPIPDRDFLPKALQGQMSVADAHWAQVAADKAAAAGEQPVADRDPNAASPAAVAEAPVPAGDASGTDDNRYKSVKGRLDAERQKRLAAEARVRELEALAVPAAPVGEGTARYVDPKDVTEYGEDFYEQVRRAAREVVENSPLVRQTAADLAETKRKAAEAAAANRQNSFLADLHAAVPNLQELNDDPGFSAYLDGTKDPRAGRTYREMLDAAVKDHDVERIAAFFSGYPAGNSAGAGAAAPANVTRQAPQAGKPSLEQFAAPGPGHGGAAPPAPAGEKRYTRADIAKHSTENTQGKWRGREAEWNRVYNDMLVAGSQGRVD